MLLDEHFAGLKTPESPAGKLWKVNDFRRCWSVDSRLEIRTNTRISSTNPEESRPLPRIGLRVPIPSLE